jgi:hypothetical protein
MRNAAPTSSLKYCGARGRQYIFVRKLVGGNRYVSSVQMKRQEGLG